MPNWFVSLFTRHTALRTSVEPLPGGTYEARLALYRQAEDVPQVVALAADDCLSLIDSLCKRTLLASQERGGVIPLLALREIIENLLHAGFRDVVVSVLGDGSVLVSDHGPGIPDKPRALRPGFTTASPALRRYIRGVGSGLTVAQESLAAIGGALRLEDNLGGGTVVSLLVPQHHAAVPEMAASQAAETVEAPGSAPATGAAQPEESHSDQPADRSAGEPKPPGAPSTVSQQPGGTASSKGEYTKRPPRPTAKSRSAPAQARAEAASQSLLSPRQERLLRLFAEMAEVGPSTASTGAGLSLASAYRELVALERLGLLEPQSGGKRRLSPRGEEVLGTLSRR